MQCASVHVGLGVVALLFASLLLNTPNKYCVNVELYGLLSKSYIDNVAAAGLIGLLTFCASNCRTEVLTG